MGPQVLLLGGKEDCVASEAVPGDQPYDEHVVVELVPVLRRVVGARIKDPHTVEDLVQETLARLMSSSRRVDPDKLHHYGAVTARHVVASDAERNDRARNRSHLLAEPAHDVNASSTLPATCLSARPAASSPTGSSSAGGALPRTTSCGCRCPGTPPS